MRAILLCFSLVLVAVAAQTPCGSGMCPAATPVCCYPDWGCCASSNPICCGNSCCTQDQTCNAGTCVDGKGMGKAPAVYSPKVDVLKSVPCPDGTMCPSGLQCYPCGSSGHYGCAPPDVAWCGGPCPGVYCTGGCACVTGGCQCGQIGKSGLFEQHREGQLPHPPAV